MAKKYALLGLLIFLIGGAAVMAASRADSISMLDGFKRTVDEAAVKIGILHEGESFWNTVDEDGIADGSPAVIPEESSMPAETPETAAAPVRETVPEQIPETESPAPLPAFMEELEYEDSQYRASGKRAAETPAAETTAEETSAVETSAAETAVEETSAAETEIDSEEESQTADGSPGEMTYERYMSMTADEREAFRDQWDSSEDYTRWYHNMMSEHENDASVVRRQLGSGAYEDVRQMESEAAGR